MLPADAHTMTSHPVHVYAGDDALITCVVRGAAMTATLPSVVWARMMLASPRELHRDDAPRELLTAGMTRVTPDQRVHVIHDAGNDVELC